MSDADGVILSVALDRCDGRRTSLGPDERIWDADGEPIGLGGVADALERGPYIEYENKARWEPDDEPWKGGEPGDWHDATSRLYSRHVVEVLEIYDDA